MVHTPKTLEKLNRARGLLANGKTLDEAMRTLKSEFGTGINTSLMTVLSKERNQVRSLTLYAPPSEVPTIPTDTFEYAQKLLIAGRIHHWGLITLDITTGMMKVDQMAHSFSFPIPVKP